MKKYIPDILHAVLTVILPVMIAAIFTGCRQSESDSAPLRWPKVNAEIDSLSQGLDMMFFLHAPEEDIKNSLAHFKDAQNRLEGKEKEKARLRKEFFLTRFNLFLGEEEEYKKGVEKLLLSVDSSSNSYLYNRVLDLVPESEARDVEEYERISRLLEYFRKKGDEVMTASTLLDLGNLLKNVRDPVQAISLYEEADSLFRRNGLDQVASFNRLNIASAAFILRDTVRGVSILEEMIKDPAIRSDSELAEKVWHNLYIEGNVRYALDSLYALKGESSGSLIETFLSNALLNEGDTRGAVVHAQKAVEKALADENDNDYAVALYNQADALSASGDTLKAYRSLIRAVELTDEMANANEPEAIKDVETERILSLHRLESELAKSRWQLRLVCMGFALLLVTGLAGYLLWRRIMKLRRRNRIANEEREKIARKLVATQIAMDETDKVLNTVGKAVGEMSGNADSAAQSREIANAIHTHKARSNDRETFIDSFTEVHPDFARRLKDCNPAITEPDVRLASYIVTGMDNKNIAATMGIRPESVKQARWRLRTKLALPKGASLEEALRDLNRPG